MTDKPRLIEVAFPLKQASLASVHEKNVRHGHISTLHIWPARRPLAACRAALLATLLPDPGDPVRRAELLDKIGGKVTFKYVTEADDAGREIAEKKEVLEGGILAWGNESDDAMDDFRKTIREEFPDGQPRVLDPFAGGGAIPLEAMRLGCRVTASDLNPVAWFVLKCTLDYPQRFAGKKWPLPEFAREWPDFVEDFLTGKVKKRRGSKRVSVSDQHQPQLDPAKISPNAQAASEKSSACFGGTLNDATLAWHVRAWGRWVLERARTELAPRFLVVGGEQTVAYLHARTARDKISLARIPLLKTFWLKKKPGRRAALLPVPLADRSGVEFHLLGERELANPDRVIEDHPHLTAWEVTAETLPDFLARGTMNRAGVWCPASGRPGMIALTMRDLRTQGQQGLLASQMTVVVVEETIGKKTRKRYRLPTEGELVAAKVEVEDLEDVFRDIPFGIPTEATPAGGGSGAARAFALHNYGLKQWGNLFTPRQLLALGVFVKHIRHAIAELQKLYPRQPEIAEAIGAYLANVLDRVADRNSIQCSWTIDYDQVRNTFARFAMGMTWDYCEVNPLIETSGGYPGQLELVAQFCDHAAESSGESSVPSVLKRSAIEEQGGPNALVLTDPPYYDAIPYSDLMDFFYVWLKRVLVGHGLTELDANFASDLSPKWDSEKRDGELIDDESRFAGNKKASKDSYEDGMARAFKASLASLTPDGRMVVVFANKEVEAWETLIGALIKGGAVVTASWPIQSERAVRVRGLSSAALSSSVWIVCRKRPANAGSGWDKVVLDRMREILFQPRDTLGGRNILQYYFDLGIRGPDFLWAALGPALEAYSAHSFVKKQAGGTMSVDEFLQQVRRLVLQFSLGELPGFREVTRETSGRGESLDLDPVTQYYLLHRAFFGLEPAPSGACILYANGCGLNETALRLVWQVLEQGGARGKASTGEDEADTDEDDSKGQYRLVDWRARAQRDGLGESRAGQPAPLIDRLHRLTFLLSANRAAEVQESYENWGLAAEPAFLPLIQALHSLADRERRAEEKKLIEALAAQLKLNRRTVVEDGKVCEVPTLSGWGAEVGRTTETISNPVETQ
jgi:adenine-specific DNA methylase